jgi:hypothetical protein
MRKRASRLFERVVLGSAMAALAFIVERRLLKAIRKKH